MNEDRSWVSLLGHYRLEDGVLVFQGQEIPHETR